MSRMTRSEIGKLLNKAQRCLNRVKKESLKVKPTETGFATRKMMCDCDEIMECIGAIQYDFGSQFCYRK